jgi:hypothetical protein
VPDAFKSKAVTLAYAISRTFVKFGTPLVSYHRFVHDHCDGAKWKSHLLLDLWQKVGKEGGKSLWSIFVFALHIVPLPQRVAKVFLRQRVSNVHDAVGIVLTAQKQSENDVTPASLQAQIP